MATKKDLTFAQEIEKSIVGENTTEKSERISLKIQGVLRSQVATLKAKKFDEETADGHLESLKPNVYVVFEESIYPNKQEIVSAQKLGSRIHVVKRFGTKDVSTSAILSKIMQES